MITETNVSTVQLGVDQDAGPELIRAKPAAAFTWPGRAGPGPVGSMTPALISWATGYQIITGARVIGLSKSAVQIPSGDHPENTIVFHPGQLLFRDPFPSGVDASLTGVTVEWGDGEGETLEGPFEVDDEVFHTFAAPGTYQVTVRAAFPVWPGTLTVGEASAQITVTV